MTKMVRRTRRLKPAATDIITRCRTLAKNRDLPSPIRERKHRLSRECYRGEVAVAFTLRIESGQSDFYKSDVIQSCVDIVEAICNENRVQAVYCFMPDHLHIVLRGQVPDSDLWKAIVDFKQRTGYWYGKNRPQIKWQKEFYDHIVRKDEHLRDVFKYLIANPVVKGATSDWQEYLYKGAIGLDFDDVVNGTY